MAAAVMASIAWDPAVRDAGASQRLTAAQSPLISRDVRPSTYGPVVDIVDDASGRQLLTHHAYERHAIASMTKLMTAILAIHRLKLNRIVTVSSRAASTPGTTMGLVAGDRLSVRALLYGMLIPSGNDAAETLAETMAGSDGRFAGLMNREAQQLHLRCSHFVTPNGLDAPNEYSCAADVVTLSRIVLRNPLLASIVSTRATGVRGMGGASFHLVSTNHLLGKYPGIIGIKTGTTAAAGASLSAAARRLGHTIVAVVLGSTESQRFADGSKLLNFGFGDYVWPTSVDTMWSTQSLRTRSVLKAAPVPRWEEPWLTVNALGTITAPYDPH